jgi:hypothetical protein
MSSSQRSLLTDAGTYDFVAIVREAAGRYALNHQEFVESFQGQLRAHWTRQCRRQAIRTVWRDARYERMRRFPELYVVQVPDDPDAEKLAQKFQYNEQRLRFEYERRLFGSFTTTLAGSPEQRDRYFCAWRIAVVRSSEIPVAAE